MDFSYLGPWIPLLAEATLLTIGVAAFALLGAAVIGILIAFLRILGGPLVTVPLVVLIDFIRGTPLLVQLLMWYLVPAVLLDLSIEPVEAALIGLSVNGGAFLSEIIRGALNAIPKGQREAAAAIGLGRVYSLRTIELPQAMPVILPAAVSFYIGLIKDTSVAFIVGLHEVMRTSQLITMQEPSHMMEIYLVAAAIYFVICFSLSRVALRLEARFQRSGIVSSRLAV